MIRTQVLYNPTGREPLGSSNDNRQPDLTHLPLTHPLFPDIVGLTSAEDHARPLSELKHDKDPGKAVCLPRGQLSLLPADRNYFRRLDIYFEALIATFHIFHTFPYLQD